VRSPLAGMTRIPLALLLATGAALLVAPAASAAVTAPAPVAIVAPSEGEVVVGDPVLRWTESDGVGYELRWNVDGALDETGALDSGETGGRAFPGSPSHQLTGLVAPMYHWQVRALPDGAWSPIASFHRDIQLDTLAPPADAPDASVAPPVAAAEAPARSVADAVSGFVWVAAASSVAGLILAVVGREWLRLRRQES
jgi:hypothetical protein